MSKIKIGKYTEADSMSNLICENYPALLVLSRFGMKLGFRDKSIHEVCSDNGVDTKTFLAIVNLLLRGDTKPNYTNYDVFILSMISYLHNSHNYFVNYRLPDIREKLTNALQQELKDLNKAVLYYFDEYVSEVRNHMSYEEKKVFPYVRSLIADKGKGKYNIGIFSKQHNQVEAKLTEFKSIIIKYYETESTNEIDNVLFDIFNCESDLALHNAVEDKLFVPAIMQLELIKYGKKS
ncbi:MAG: hemerythrin domain-containing protein [Prevotellaceae bacterium]|jgi:regulator of cell morphogenesis and NO signaling|nr:hemerythrin domain-containing protein [Prevotellaceae bacterium]